MINYYINQSIKNYKLQIMREFLKLIYFIIFKISIKLKIYIYYK